MNIRHRMFIFWILMDIPEYTFKECGYSGSLQDIANILEYPQEQVLFSGNHQMKYITLMLTSWERDYFDGSQWLLFC